MRVRILQVEYTVVLLTLVVPMNSFQMKSLHRRSVVIGKTYCKLAVMVVNIVRDNMVRYYIYVEGSEMVDADE